MELEFCYVNGYSVLSDFSKESREYFLNEKEKKLYRVSNSDTLAFLKNTTLQAR